MTVPRFYSKLFFISMFAVTIFFTSCKDNENTEEVAPTEVQEATLEQKKQALENVVPSNTGNTANSGGAVNPAHGQPGHRCDLPVGAPLNSAGGSTNTAPAINATNTIPTSTTGKGINPPHGQPGHKCEVKVGDPL